LTLLTLLTISALATYQTSNHINNETTFLSSREAEQFATFDKSSLRNAGQVSSVNLIIP